MSIDHAEAKLAEIADTLNATLKELYGGERGFMIFVFKSEPSEPGPGLMLTNVAEECVISMLQDAIATLDDPHFVDGKPATH